MLNGATLCPFNLKEEGVHRLAQWLVAEEVTMIHTVPMVFRHLVAALTGTERFPKLRLIRLGGETAHRNDADSYKRHFDRNCILHLGLGTSETGTTVQCFLNRENDCGNSLVPVGYAAEDIEVLLLAVCRT